jgi:UDP-glucose 6-dehydrogenase
MPTAMMIEEATLDAPEKRRKYTVGVVGCGRIGLPTACLFAEAGFKVIGADVNILVPLQTSGRPPLSVTSLYLLFQRQLTRRKSQNTRSLKNPAKKLA